MRIGLGFYKGDACYDPSKYSWLPDTSTADNFTELACYLGLTPPLGTIPITPPPVTGRADTGSIVSVNDPNNTVAAMAAGAPTDQTLFQEWSQRMSSNTITEDTSTSTPGWVWGLGIAAVLLVVGFVGGRR